MPTQSSQAPSRFAQIAAERKSRFAQEAPPVQTNAIGSPTDIQDAPMMAPAAPQTPAVKQDEWQEPMIDDGQGGKIPVLDWIHSLPGGKKSVKKVMWLRELPGSTKKGKDFSGYVWRRNPSSIGLRKDLGGVSQEEMKALIAHEVGHSIAYGDGKRPDKLWPWGKGLGADDTYVSTYAKTNDEEDWAETYSNFALGKPFGSGLSQKRAAMESYFKALDAAKKE